MDPQSLGQRIRDRSIVCRNASSRICNLLLMITFLLLMVLALSSLGVFAEKHHDIKVHANQSGYDCILYVTEARLKKGRLSDGASCGFAIGGNVIVALGAGLYLLSYLIKAAIGAPVLSLLTVVELTSLFLLFLLSLTVSIDIGAGLEITCGSYNSKISCDKYYAPGTFVRFYEKIRSSEIISWVITLILLVLIALYIILSIAFCIRRSRKQPNSMSVGRGTESLLSE